MISILQVIVSIILIILVLLQERGGGLGALGGGGGTGTPYQTKRGIGRFMFWATIVAVVLFTGLAVLSLVHVH